MKKIVFLSPASELGGAERSLVDLAKSVEHLGLKPLVILPRKGPLKQLILGETGASVDIIKFPAAFKRLGRRFSFMSFIFLFVSAIRLPFYLIQVKRWIKNHNPDFVHSNGIKTHILLPLITHNTHCTSIIHLREFMPDNAMIKILLNRAIKKVDQVWANSNSVAKQFMREGIEIKVIHNIVERSKFYQRPLPEEGKFRLGCFGVLVPNKGQHVFIEILEHLKRRHRSFEGWIVGGEIYDAVGTKGYERQLKELTHKLNLQDQVIFKGYQTDIAQLMHQCRFILLTTIHYDAFPRVVLEGMSCGRVVIASKVGGPEEMIDHMLNGCLVSPGKTEEYVDCIESLIQNPALEQKIIANAQENVRKFFSFDSMCNKLKTFLNV